MNLVIPWVNFNAAMRLQDKLQSRLGLILSRCTEHSSMILPLVETSEQGYSI